jgi:4-hydroxy-3-methylbut-2-en-1-yl diphosphate reductase
MKTTRIIRASHLGMCFGVRDALTLATETATHLPKEQRLNILGDLVHNPVVLSQLEELGVQTHPHDALPPQPGSPVMITAHGTSDTRRQSLKDQGFRVLDATCPLVHRAHAALRKLVQNGFHPVVIGQRHHVEVRGLTGDFPEASIVLTETDIESLGPYTRIGVVSQTTQPIDFVRNLVQRIRERFPDSEVLFKDTVCQPTKDRQIAAQSLAQQADVVVVVGGPHSNNTRQLAERCRKDCPRVHTVSTAAELDPTWFHQGDTIGLTAGTSTPDGIVDTIEYALRRMALENAAPTPRPQAASEMVESPNR